MTKRRLRHLSVEAVEAIHDEVLAAHGGMPGLRSRALLESAIAAPQASYGGDYLIIEPIEIAAAYLFYLARNHAFLDGNKRTALASCLLFLQLNELLPTGAARNLDPDAWEALMVGVGASRLDRDQTTERLRALLELPNPDKP